VVRPGVLDCRSKENLFLAMKLGLSRRLSRPESNANNQTPKGNEHQPSRTVPVFRPLDDLLPRQSVHRRGFQLAVGRADLTVPRGTGSRPPQRGGAGTGGAAAAEGDRQRWRAARRRKRFPPRRHPAGRGARLHRHELPATVQYIPTRPLFRSAFSVSSSRLRRSSSRIRSWSDRSRSGRLASCCR
jgi:hypothetical protein